MAQQALPPGAARRRAVFGLLDADGWGYAGIKATFWFLLILFLLGYIPNFAYYFTVSNTVDLGYNAVPIVNFCDAGNDRAGRQIPCPAPAGTVIPWDPSPAQLAVTGGGRSNAVAVQSGSHIYLAGGKTSAGASADVLQTTVSVDGNLSPWTPGPALPAPRSDAALAILSGVPYIIGGLDANGQPTDTVFAGVLSAGEITGWARADGTQQGVPNLTLPAAVSGAGAVATATGLYVIGGQTAGGPVTTVLHTAFGTSSPPALGAWQTVTALPLPEARTDAAAVLDGNFLFVVGGTGPSGVTDTVFRLALTNGEPSTDPTTKQLTGWATPGEGKTGTLPAPRARAAGFTANGALYVIGGADSSGTPQASNFWSVPDATTGDILAWSRLSATDLPEGRAGAAIASVGSTVFLTGGDTPGGTSDNIFRAALSPKPPFFRLGLFGATIPALSIKGEIGQQLGYIDAMSVGMVNFGLLVLIGLAFSHRAATMRLIERLSRGRFRAPREDEFTAGGA